MSDETLVEVALAEVAGKMAKAVTHTQTELAGVRSSRPSAALVERIVVEYYGSEVPLRQLAGFHVPEPRLLAITPFDKGALKAIEKAIQASDLGITPSSDGQVIRLAFPPLTEERRKDLVKIVRHLAEEGRVAVRNARRAARHELEALEKAGEISADDLERAEKGLEKLTHEEVAALDRVLAAKEQELLEV